MPQPYLTRVYDIDPTFENPEDIQQMLMSLLEGYPSKYYWEAGVEYKFQENANSLTVVRLSHHILKRNRTNTKGTTGIRYECIVPGQIAKGGSSAVFNSAGTLDETGRFKNTKQRLVKIEKWYSNMPPFSAMHPKFTNEKWNALISLTHMKEAVTYRNRLFTVMKKMPGRELFQIIADDLSKDNSLIESKLTIEQRFKLTFAFLYAFKEQISDINLIHGDIKPENTMVYLSAEELIVSFIDFDHSFLGDAPMEEQSGTFVYFSPELVNKQSLKTKQSDIYAMGRVIALLWGNSFNSYSSDWQYASYVQNPHLDNLFSTLEEKSSLSEYVKNIIKDTLILMHHPKPEQRPSIEEVIECFSLIDPQAKLSDIINIGEKYSALSLSISQKIELSQQMLQALNNQYTKDGQVHGNLSPEVFRVNLGSGTIRVHIMPTASTVTGTDTYNHAANELFFKGVVATKASDVYAIAQIIQRLWSDNSLSNAQNQRPTLKSLHQRDPLSDHNASTLDGILSLMLDPNDETRTDLDTAIGCFSKLDKRNLMDYENPAKRARITPSNPL